MNVPAQLQNAINTAAAAYGINPDWLIRIWQFESGGTYPNPAVNSIGCGGLFGLCQSSSAVDPATGAVINLNATNNTQAQANAAAYTLSRLLNRYGNIYDAMLAYSGGSANEASFVAGAVSAVGSAVSSVLARLRAFYSAVVTQGFGPSSLSLEPAYNGYAHFHEGVDLGVSAGTAVPALVGGTVTKVVNTCGLNDPTCGNGYGNQIWVRLSDGSQVLYGHLQSAATSVGASISAGQIIGVSGNTGASTGAHIHIGLLNAAGRWVDPSSLIQSALNTASGPNVIQTGLPIVGGAVSGFSDLLGKIGAALNPGSWGSAFLGALGPALRAYFTLGLFLDPLFVVLGVLMVLIGTLGLVLGHGDTKQTIKYAATLAA